MRRKLGSTAPQGLRILACGAVLVAATTGASAAASDGRMMLSASAARTVTLSETAHLEPGKQEVPGSEISESGRATGTYDVPVLAGLQLDALRRVGPARSPGTGDESHREASSESHRAGPRTPLWA